MLFKSLFVAALGASGISAHVAPRQEEAGRFGCGTAPPDAEHIGYSKLLALQEAKELESGNLTARATININVYFHVVASSTSVANGYLTDTMLANQLKVLNDDFAPYDIAFNLVGTDRTINTAWASDSGTTAMKTALRKGTYRDLNVYFQYALVRNALGYATLPVATSTGSSAFIADGVSLNAQTVPGGSIARYNLGRTATHEVGHWLGLYHTFEAHTNPNGCTGNGDFVADTPAQATSSSGCPVGRDSCPTVAGLDPITNYMDYSDDSCYEEFTPGQKTRMTSYWNTFRA